MLVDPLGIEHSFRARFSSRSQKGFFSTQRIAMILAVTVLFAPSLTAGPLAVGLPSDYFPIGVFYQPANAVATTTFAGWKGRGVNTLIGYETQGYSISIDDYTIAAADAGLLIIREPNANPATDNAPNLIGWLQPDEPELRGINPATLNAQYATWKVANPTRPVLINFAGAFMVSGFAPLKTQADYAPYIQAGDWVAQDLYPVTGWNQPNALGAVGMATATLHAWSNKPTIAYIETSNQRLTSNSTPEALERGPTPSEVRAEIWDSIIHGARGIAYFPQEIHGFRYDATPIDVAAEITRQDATITGLAPALTSDIVPDVTSVAFTNHSIEYVTRSFGGVTYLIALNLSNISATTDFSANFTQAANGLTILGTNQTLLPIRDNTFSDVFGPYEVRIYAEGGVGFAALAIPEPSGFLCLVMGTLIFRYRFRRLMKPASSPR